MTKDQEFQLRKQAADRGYNPQQINQFIQFAKQKTPAAQPTPPQKEKGEGFLKSLVKDPIKTLVVKPGTRIAQAGVSAYGALTGNTELQDRAAQDTNVKIPLLGNFKIEGQKTGLAGAKQIAGDAAKSASYLYTPGKAASVLKGGLSGAVKKGVIQGAKTGAIGGGLYTGGQAAQDNKSAGGIFMDTLKGATAGAITGGAIGGAVPLAAKGAQGASSLVKKGINKVSPNMGLAPEAKIIASRNKELTKLENSYAALRKQSTKASERSIDVKKMLAETDLLHNAVDETGTIRTQNAISELNEFIRPQEDVISKSLQNEGRKIPLAMVEAKLKAAVNDSGLKGGAKLRALKNVADDIEGYALEADKDGYISVAVIHDAKVDKYANINYLNPESKRADKAIAKGLKEMVEEHTKSVDVKGLNEELSQYYTLQKYLEALDGKKVDGGKLGKYFAQTVGSIVGSHFGPLGTIVGAEVGGRIKGAQLSSKLGGKIGRQLEQSTAMKSAVEKTKGKIIRLP